MIGGDCCWPVTKHGGVFTGPDRSACHAATMRPCLSSSLGVGTKSHNTVSRGVFTGLDRRRAPRCIQPQRVLLRRGQGVARRASTPCERRSLGNFTGPDRRCAPHSVHPRRVPALTRQGVRRQSYSFLTGLSCTLASVCIVTITDQLPPAD